MDFLQRHAPAGAVGMRDAMTERVEALARGFADHLERCAEDRDATLLEPSEDGDGSESA